MKTVEMPFAPGDKVRTSDGEKFIITEAQYWEGSWRYSAFGKAFYDASTLTLVERCQHRDSMGYKWSSVVQYWTGSTWRPWSPKFCPGCGEEL